MPCDGCGRHEDRCGCDGDGLPEDMAFGFHVIEPDEHGDYYEELQ